MRIIFDNQVLSNTISAASENANYPVSNLNDSRLSRKYRAGGLTDQWILISGSNIKASYVAIMNHNLTANATVLIQGNDTNDFSNPAYSEVISPDWHTMIKEVANTVGIETPGNLYGGDLYGGGLYGPSIISEVPKEFNYWRISISDSMNTDGYIEIGGIYLAEFVQMQNVESGMVLAHNTTARSSISGSGQAYGDPNYKFRGRDFSMIANTFEKREEILTMFEAMDNFRPVLALIWEDDLLTEKPMYSVIARENLSYTKTLINFTGVLAFQMSLRETF